MKTTTMKGIDPVILAKTLHPLHDAGLSYGFFNDLDASYLPIRVAVDGFGTLTAEMIVETTRIISTYPDTLQIPPQEAFTEFEAFHFDTGMGQKTIEDSFEFEEDIFDGSDEDKDGFYNALACYNERNRDTDYPFTQIDFDQLRLEFDDKTGDAWEMTTISQSSYQHLLYLRIQQGYAIINDRHWIVMKKQGEVHLEPHFAIPLWVFDCIRNTEDTDAIIKKNICVRYNDAIASVLSIFPGGVFVKFQNLKPDTNIDYIRYLGDLEGQIAVISNLIAPDLDQFMLDSALRQNILSVKLTVKPGKAKIEHPNGLIILGCECTAEQEHSIYLDPMALHKVLREFSGEIEIAIAPNLIRITDELGDRALLAGVLPTQDSDKESK